MQQEANETMSAGIICYQGNAEDTYTHADNNYCRECFAHDENLTWLDVLLLRKKNMHNLLKFTEIIGVWCQVYR